MFPLSLSLSRAVTENCLKRFYVQHQATSTEGEIRILVLKWGNFLSIHEQASEKVGRLELDWEASREASSGTVSQQVVEREGVKNGLLRPFLRLFF